MGSATFATRTLPLLALLATACGPETLADLDAADAEQQQAVTQVGDWTGFTGGQCVHGVYQFYLHRYGISLTGACAQPGNVGTCQNCGACMIWQSAAVEPSPALFNKYAWGTAMPQTYDIVVYPPRSGTGPGHVACVDHLQSGSASDWGSLYVMDSNYSGNELQASAVHTVSRAPYGFYRLKSLDHPDAAPHGYLDGATCDSFGGWAQDADAPTQAINVDAYYGGAAGSGVPAERLDASLSRPDLCTAIGSCAHGYAWLTPRALMDGAAHDIHVYGIDASGSANAELTGSPKSVTCTGAETGVRRHIGSPTTLAAWAFSTFYDLRPIADATFDAYEAATPWPDAPVLVQAAGDPTVYVMDGAYKRHVTDPDSAAAWHFDLGAVQALTPAQLAAMPTGPALRPRPMLIKGTGPSVDVLDDPLPEPDAGTPVVTPVDAGPRADAGSGSASTGSTGSTSGSIEVTGGCTSASGADLLGLGVACWLVRRRVSGR